MINRDGRDFHFFVFGGLQCHIIAVVPFQSENVVFGQLNRKDQTVVKIKIEFQPRRTFGKGFRAVQKNDISEKIVFPAVFEQRRHKIVQIGVGVTVITHDDVAGDDGNDSPLR